MKTTKKALVGAALAATAALVLSGCSASGSSSGPVTVTMWARAATSPITKQLVKEYNASQSKVKVQLTVLPLNQEDAKFAAATRSGNVPDLFGMNDVSIPQYAATGALKPVDDFMKGLPMKSELNPGQMDLGKVNGQQYGVPLMQDLSVMWINKTLFQKAGLDPSKAPTNAKEIEADAAAITKLGGGVKGFSFGGNCGGCNVFAMAPTLFANGQKLVSGSTSDPKVEVDATPFKNTLTMLKTMWDNGDMPASDQTEDGSTFGQDFIAGKIGITFNGLGTILSAKPKGFDYAAAPIPGATGSYSTFSGGDEFVLPAKGQHAEQAEDFVKFVLQKKQQQIYPEYGYTPVRTDAMTSKLKAENPAFAVALKASTKGYAPKTPAFQSLFSNSGPFGPIFQKAVFAGDIAGALKTGQAGFESTVKSAG
ncbi:sugar ABC transporter substrate-binding protein [Curtobacterium sp. MCBD17_040]|uniref:ABC transporter substrate-binding protein n=1 Tax=Curtobacterium sp. MCBD17_040 TaxID=2175674 RepID=UPI000DA99F1F|nr:sugar ABC transporter substrate-binding protein [Curtobacterium sp. MCBD17_040]WIB65544.1 sugar ABC transporter substrate-binding protein [Curtobacterium sp. MCBD17_040]